jgi:BASS family bile acid:Na+ symporter
LVTVLACVAGCALHTPVAVLRHCHPLPGVTPPMLMLVAAMFIGGFYVRAADLARALLRPGLLLAGLGVASSCCARPPVAIRANLKRPERN